MLDQVTWQQSPGASTPMMLGPMKMSTIDPTRPQLQVRHTAPAVLKRFQKMENTITGRLAEAATAKASATRNATLAVGPSRIAMAMEMRTDHERRDASHAYFFARCSAPFPDG